MVLLVTQESVDVRELAGQIASGETPWKDRVEPRPEEAALDQRSRWRQSTEQWS